MFEFVSHESPVLVEKEKSDESLEGKRIREDVEYVAFSSSRFVNESTSPLNDSRLIRISL